MAFYTPLRYPGGKGKLAYYIKEVIVANRLQDGNYVEPYAGGAGIALELLIQEYVRNIYINDADPAIFHFWHSVVNDTDSFCKKIYETPVNIDTWKIQKRILNNPNLESSLDIGFATFFLNRTNRSGILKAGVIGGNHQLGNWKLDARYNTTDLIKRIELIANYRDRIHLNNMDAIDYLVHVTTTLRQNTLIYLDPPYYHKGQGLYRNFYNHEDHIKIMEMMKTITDTKWLISYDNSPEIKEIYEDFIYKEYSLQYAVQNKRIGEEVMIYADNVKIPELILGKGVFNEHFPIRNSAA